MPLPEGFLCVIMCTLEMFSPSGEYAHCGPATKRPVRLELIRERLPGYAGFLKDVAVLDLHGDQVQEVGPWLGRACPRLRRLYLHNNLIEHLDGSDWRRLKVLQVLVLALNSLSSLAGLEHLQCLEHLDASFNVIDLPGLQESVQFLRTLPRLCDLYMVGNPCELEWTGYRLYVIGNLPSLKRFDGRDIHDEERALAAQQLNPLSCDLHQKVASLPVRSTEAERRERELAAMHELLFDGDD
jgi:protein TilB